MIKNNKTIIKLNLENCINIFRPKSLQLFNSLILNKTINTINLNNINIINSAIFNLDFIDKISKLILNNNTLNKIIISPYYGMNVSDDGNFYLDNELMPDEYYNKVKNALHYNYSLVDIQWFDLTFKENYKKG